MATDDLSRAAYYPGKRYAGVKMQQGRVLTDDDFNEQERLNHEDKRLTRIDVIGASGSPDQGFAISNAGAGNGIDFTINAGTLYLGGLRLLLQQAQTFKLQEDRLQKADTDAPAGERYDMVYVETWQQTVSAVEDGELYEKALGGPDTTTRRRTMCRVKLHTDVGSVSCADAWSTVVSAIENSLGGEMSGKYALVSDALLTLDYEEGGDAENLCLPSVLAGYLGAENQAIRVQLTDPDHFTWCYDNGAPLYRVKIKDQSTLILLTEPKDQAHWPQAGQIVEILPWSAVLENGEKLAEELISGHFSRINDSYNPDSGEISLTTSISTDFGAAWEDRDDADDLRTTRFGSEDLEDIYYFMRVWDRGADRTSEPQIAVTAGPQVLGTTGLNITINGNHRLPGDHWIIAARPETPDQVVPWELEKERQPQGYCRFYTPLAVIHWQPGGDATAEPVVYDCRQTFQPLTALDCCCTITVGDGKISTGDFQTLEDALLNLPAQGGTICLLQGLHMTNSIIENRENIIIKGCGPQTKVVPNIGATDGVVFTIRDSKNIVVEYMDIAALDGAAFVMKGSELGALNTIAVRHTRILACNQAIRVVRGVRINIHNNSIRMLDKKNGDAAIYLQGEDSAIERNDILVVPAEKTPLIDQPDHGDTVDPLDPCAEFEFLFLNIIYFYSYIELYWNIVITAFPESPYKTEGGIQISGSSERVLIRDNRINGGAGNGITLGGQLDLSVMGEDVDVEEEDEQLDYHVNAINGYVAGAMSDKKGDALSGIQYSLINAAGQSVSNLSQDDGAFGMAATDGQHRIMVTTPGYAVSGIKSVAMGRTNYYLVSLKKVEVIDKPPNDDPLGFIYDLSIVSNHIVNMGLCGIGPPRIEIVGHGEISDINIADNRNNYLRKTRKQTYNRSLISVMGPKQAASVVIGLDVFRNHISDCLKTPFVTAMRDKARSRGYGGIVLLMCEDASIHENVIKNNGASHLEPVCGIVARGSLMDISDNKIINNGPLTANPLQSEMIAGIRGGIVLNVYAIPITSRIDSKVNALRSQSRVADLLQSNYAARMHDNVVSQPAGPALAIVAMGTLSILNNRLYSQISGPVQVGGLTVTPGAVYIANIARGYTVGLQQGQSPTPENDDATENGNHDTGGNDTLERLTNGMRISTNVTQLSMQQNFFSAYYGQSTLFNSNQVRLGLARNCPVSVLVTTLGDVGFSANQCDIDMYDAGLVGNTYLLGATVRATDNRFIEMVPSATGNGVEIDAGDSAGSDTNMRRDAVMMEYSNMTVGRVVGSVINQIYPLSLLTQSFLANITSHNQGYHCIIALPPPVANNNLPTVFAGNQMPAGEACSALGRIILQALAVGLKQDVLTLLR